MKITNTFRPTLAERACATVELGRELNRRAALAFPAEVPDTVARALRRLGDRDPFDPAAEVGLQALRALVATELGEAQDAAHSGAMPRDGEDPAETARTEALAALLDVFDRFRISRDITLDEVAAERALQRLMRAGCNALQNEEQAGREMPEEKKSQFGS